MLLRFFVKEGYFMFDDPQKATKGAGRGGYVIKDAKAIQKLKKLEKKAQYLLQTKATWTNEEIERGLSLSE